MIASCGVWWHTGLILRSVAWWWHSGLPIFLPHFRLYEVVSLHVCVLPYKYRKILERLLKLMKLCNIIYNGEQGHAWVLQAPGRGGTREPRRFEILKRNIF